MNRRLTKQIVTVTAVITIILCPLFCACGSEQTDIARYDSVRQLVRMEVNNHNYQSAISILNEFIDDTESENVMGQAYILLGNVYFAISDFYKANETYEEAEALLVGTANPKLEKKLVAARTKIVEVELEHIRQALENYYSDNISYPENLSALLQANPGLSIHDPWSKTYFYAPSTLDIVPGMENQDYALYSQGASGQEQLGFQDSTARNRDILSQLEARATDSTGFPNNYRVKNISVLESGEYGAVLVSTGYLQETTQVKKDSTLPDDIAVKAVLPEGVVMERNKMLGAVIYIKSND